MANQIGKTGFQRSQVFLVQIGLCTAAVMLQGANGSNDNNGVGIEACIAALDVQEFFGTQVGAEAGLGDHIIAQL